MERYTEKHYTGNGHYLLCSGTCETLNCGDCGILDKIVDRLAAYEDTGLTPEEVQQMRWIPVEERLPEPGKRVLATDCGFVGEFYINKRGKWQRYNVNCYELLMALDILYWMPLPASPAKEDQK